MTYSTLASIIKYPYASVVAGPKPKFGFFQSEEDSFLRLAEKLGLKVIEIEGQLDLDMPTTELFEHKHHRYCRHPLCFLVEAADDICYQIMDIEDAHNLKLLSTADTQELLLGFFQGEMREKVARGLNRSVICAVEPSERWCMSVRRYSWSMRKKYLQVRSRNH